ncbi:MAG: hypothetical protein C5S48_08415 [Candidatus Methanogaster sp.]|nr:MAG: hypothetical protein C5S48_08415 [ANME-2 cluster archaeon]
MKHDLDSEEAKELLRNTFIKPERTEVLFELYWVIRVIGVKSGKELKDVKFNITDGTNNIVAEWEDSDCIYRIYHDSNGSFQFLEKYEDVFKDTIIDKDGYLAREKNVFRKWKGMRSEVFSLERGDSFWGGRPDILLEKYKKGSDNPEQIFIGEVKYTDLKEYAARGLKELLECMALIKSDGGYFEEKGKIFESDIVNGYLFVDKIDDVKTQTHKNVKIIRFGDPFRDLHEVPPNANPDPPSNQRVTRKSASTLSHR